MDEQDGEDEFARVLSEAIRARGLSLQRLRHRLSEHGVAVSVATLSYWQNGRSRPTRAHSQHILSVLEQVLALRPGTLLEVAPSTETRRRPGGTGTSGAPMPRTVEEVLELTGLAPLNLRKVSTQISVTVDAERNQVSESVRNVVQCLKSGTAGFPVVVEHDEVRQEVRGVSNCTAGAVWDVPEQGLRVTEMRLGRPLRQGEYLMLEYQLTLTAGTQGTHEFVIATPKLMELVVEITFPDDDLPNRVVGYTRSVDEDPGPEAPDAVELPVAGGVAQLIRMDAAPAINVVRWSWDAASGVANPPSAEVVGTRGVAAIGSGREPVQ